MKTAQIHFPGYVEGVHLHCFVLVPLSHPGKGAWRCLMTV